MINIISFVRTDFTRFVVAFALALGSYSEASMAGDVQREGLAQQSFLADTTAAVQFTATKDASPVGLQLDHVFHLDPLTILLSELSGQYADQGFGTLSGGIALRRILPDSKTVVGVNVFYDALRDSDGFSYSQIGFGGEISRGRFTLRGNYYLPVGDNAQTTTRTRVHDEKSDVIEGANGRDEYIVNRVTQTWTMQRNAMDAWDVELEMALLDRPKFFDPVVAVGYYGMKAGGADYSGVKARGEVRMGEHVSLGVEWRQDAREIGQEWRASIRFQFALGRPPVKSESHNVGIRYRRGDLDEESLTQHNDGKTVHVPKRDGKSVVSDGKSMLGDGKALLEPEPEEEPELPRGFLDPVKRTPWPNTVAHDHLSTSRSSFTISDPCNCGNPLVFP